MYVHAHELSASITFIGTKKQTLTVSLDLRLWKAYVPPTLHVYTQSQIYSPESGEDFCQSAPTTITLSFSWPSKGGS